MSMITFAEAKAAKPKQKDYTLTDGNGLYLRVWPNGKKVWLFQKKINGKIQKKTIGIFPDMGISDARLSAKSLTDELTVSTSDESRKREIQSMTFRQVYDAWFELKQDEVKNWRDISGRFKNHVLPKLGSKAFGSLLPLDVLDALKPLVTDKKYETIKRICIWLKQIEDYAFNAGIIETERLQKISKLFKQPKGEHRATLPPDEIKTFFKEALTSPRASLDIINLIKVAFFTLLRPGEYTAMKWEWVKEDIIEVPAEFMKMKRPHRVPISKQLKTMLEQIPHRGEFVFYTPRAHDGHYSINALTVFFKRIGYKDRLTPHGIRSIGRTWMAENKVPFEVAELSLAHSVGSQTVQAYNRTDLLEERKEAMQRWCNFVDEQMKG